MTDLPILALDAATNVGWAAWDPEPAAGDPPLVYGTYEINTKAPLVEQCVEMGSFIRGMLDIFRPALVVYEAPWVGQFAGAAAKLFRLQGTVFYIAGVEGKMIVTPTVKEIRSHFVGDEIKEARAKMKAEGKKGAANLEKKIVFKKCVALGYTPNNFDESDALAVLHYGRDVLAPKVKVQNDG